MPRNEPTQHRVDHDAELLLRLLVEADAEVGAGVVAEDRDRPELGLRAGDGLGPLVGLLDLQADGDGPPAGLLDVVRDGLGLLQEEVGDADGRALLGEDATLRAAHRPAAAGHQRDLAFEFHGASLPLSSHDACGWRAGRTAFVVRAVVAAARAGVKRLDRLARPAYRTRCAHHVQHAPGAPQRARRLAGSVWPRTAR